MSYPPQDAILQASDGTIATLKNVGSAYGEMSEVNEAGTAISVVTAGTFVGWVTATAETMDPNSNVTFVDNGTADRLLIGTDGAGVYRVMATVCGETTANREIQVAIFKNGTQDASARSDTTGQGAGNEICTSIIGLITLAAGDYLDLRLSSDVNTTTITVKHINMVIERVR